MWQRYEYQIREPAVQTQKGGNMTEAAPGLVARPEPDERRFPAKRAAKNVTEVDTQKQVTSSTPPSGERKRSYIVLMMLMGGAVLLAYGVFGPFVTPLFLALVLTITFPPVHEWIALRVRSPNIAAMVATVTVVFLILMPLVFISFKLSTEATNLYGSLSRQWGGLGPADLRASPKQSERAAEQTGTPPAQFKSTITARVQKFGVWVVGMVERAARGLVQQMTTALFALLALFFFLRDRKEFGSGIANLLPLPPQRAEQLSTALDQTIMANIYGACAVGLLQGILIAFCFWITGLRAPLFWGAIARIFSFRAL